MIDLIREFGLPTALCVVILAFSGVGLRWFAKSIAQPFIDAHLDLIGHLRQSLTEQMEVHQELKAKLDRNEKDHDRILRVLEQ